MDILKILLFYSNLIKQFAFGKDCWTPVEKNWTNYPQPEKTPFINIQSPSCTQGFEKVIHNSALQDLQEHVKIMV